MNPYDILNVSKEATPVEIKKAYRKLAAKYHPDKGGDEKQFKQINEAYSIIGTVEKRQEYEAAQSFGNFGDVFSGFEDIFEGFFGNKSQTRRQQKIQTDNEIIFDFKVSLSQIKKGFSQNIVFNRNKKCNKCNGQGGKNKRVCNGCNGFGVQTIHMGNVIQQSTCRSCFGAGYSLEQECPLCQGSGAVQVKENIIFSMSGK